MLAQRGDATSVARRDMSIRVTAKPIETNGFAGILARTQNLNDSIGYFAGVGHSAEFGGNILIAGVGLTNNEQNFKNSSNGGPVFPLPYNVLDAMSELQIDVFGDEIRVWAWKEGTDMPAEPQFSFRDSTYTDAGHVRLVAPKANHEMAVGGAALFQSIHVADMPIHEIIPEPATATLGFVFAGIAIATWRRRI